MKDYTFTGARYITKGIANDLPGFLVMYLWLLIDERKTDENLPMDYLQVFNLKPVNKQGRVCLSITHSQEVPHYKKAHILEKFTDINGKIYVIDDIDYVTMLFAEEY